jgi:hypothetical protein
MRNGDAAAIRAAVEIHLSLTEQEIRGPW